MTCTLGDGAICLIATYRTPSPGSPPQNNNPPFFFSRWTQSRRHAGTESLRPKSPLDAPDNTGNQNQPDITWLRSSSWKGSLPYTEPSIHQMSAIPLPRINFSLRSEPTLSYSVCQGFHIPCPHIRHVLLLLYSARLEPSGAFRALHESPHGIATADEAASAEHHQEDDG